MINSSRNSGRWLFMPLLIALLIAMGIGLFAPPLGLGLYGACLIGGAQIEETVKPMLCWLGLLLACLVVIAFVSALTQ